MTCKYSHFSLSLLILWAGLSRAQSNAQNEFAGVSVSEGGNVVLKDLNARSCLWMSGVRLERSMPVLQTFLSRLERLNPIYRQLLEAQLGLVNFCFSENRLISVKEVDAGRVTVVGADDQQLAIRVGNEIYADQALFSKLDVDGQAFLVVHELMHVYFDAKLARRNDKLRGFTQFLFELHKLAPGVFERDFENWRQELNKQIYFNSVQWPRLF